MMKQLAEKMTRLFAKVQAYVYALGVLFLMSFAEIRQNNQYCKKAEIIIENQVNNHFIDDNDIVTEVLLGNNNLGLFKKIDSISLKTIEEKLLKNAYIGKAEASRRLDGNLSIKVVLKRPQLRVVRPALPDFYLTEKGERLPLSDKFTARVLTIDGDGCNQLGLNWHGEKLGNDTAEQALTILVKLTQDPDWNAMFTHAHINERLEITLYPLLGANEIEFGNPTDAEEKMKYLHWYYKKIIPHRGLDAYRKVSLKFKNQIICQKRT
jgi:cell division protein FtsQ